MDSSLAVFATGCLVGVVATLASLLLADAFANKFPEDAKRSSRRIRGTTAVLLVGLAWITYTIGLDKSSAMLLMLFVIFLCAKIGGFGDVLGLSALSVCLLVYYFLPPIQSWEVANPKDKISLALFIVAALVAGLLIRERGRSRLFPNSIGASQK